MPRWVVYCPQCHNTVPYGEVTFERSTANAFAWLDSKPVFPDGGFSLECPSCKETSLYQRHQLVYTAR